jgi:outer membrane protein TolC
MWSRFAFLSPVVIAAGLAGCGPGGGSYRQSLAAYSASRPPADGGAGVDAELFAGAATLEREPLIAAVLDRNPSLESARQAWRAALARYPQEVSLEDPMLGYGLAPLSVASDEVRLGQTVELSQSLPFPGKRRLRGEVALAEADARRYDLDAVRLRLATMASRLYYDLYVAERALEVNAEYQAELSTHRDTLSAHLAAGHAWQDDALKVDIELVEAMQAKVELEAERDLIIARMNELLHRRPELPLPPTPETLALAASPQGESAALQELALRDRPALSAAAARVRREGARVDLAEREQYPDFRLSASYNSMFAGLEHQLMVGVAINLPLWRSRRRAAVDQAEAGRARAEAESREIEDRVRGEVERALRNYRAALEVVTKYRDEIVPATESRVEAIRLGLQSGRSAFIEILRADHDLLSARLGYHRALAAAHRRRVDLEIALGTVTAGAADGGSR